MRYKSRDMYRHIFHPHIRDMYRMTFRIVCKLDKCYCNNRHGNHLYIRHRTCRPTLHRYYRIHSCRRCIRILDRSVQLHTQRSLLSTSHKCCLDNRCQGSHSCNYFRFCLDHILKDRMEYLTTFMWITVRFLLLFLI